MITFETLVEQNYSRQCKTWPLLAENIKKIAKSKTRSLKVNSCKIDLQHNPLRLPFAICDSTSTSEEAGTNCPLCSANRPKEQEGIDYKGSYEVICNPYPLYPYHFVIVSKEHAPQRLFCRMRDFLHLAKELTHYELFYNGSACGASVGEHFHVQAIPKGHLPYLKELKTTCFKKKLFDRNSAQGYVLSGYMRKGYFITSTSIEALMSLFSFYYRQMHIKQLHKVEPMMNVIVSYKEGVFSMAIFSRRAYLPSCFHSEDEQSKILINPSALDMSGLLILPREEDFDKITVEDIEKIYSEITGI